MMGAKNKRGGGRPPGKAKGVFCLEGDWWNDLNTSASVRPLLDLLAAGGGRVPYVHRDVATRDELDFYLGKWTLGRYSTYPLLYLAFHGSEQAIHLSDGRRASSEVTLDALETLLDGRCAKRVIHFGGCMSVVGDERRLKRFLRNTGALALTGFTRDVAWLDGAAFEVLLFATFQRQALTRAGMRAVTRRVKEELGGMARELGFRMVVRDE